MPPMTVDDSPNQFSFQLRITLQTIYIHIRIQTRTFQQVPGGFWTPLNLYIDYIDTSWKVLERCSSFKPAKPTEGRIWAAGGGQLEVDRGKT